MTGAEESARGRLVDARFRENRKTLKTFAVCRLRAGRCANNCRSAPDCPSF